MGQPQQCRGQEASAKDAAGPEAQYLPESTGGAKNKELDTSERQEVQRLAARDREVRAHESAHMAAGGSLVRGGAQFDYKRGPDGVLYAVGGEVSIETSNGRTPEETLRKAETIRRAALAPADPSAQDRSVAAAAAKMAAEARQEMAQQTFDEASGDNQTTAATRAIGSYQAQSPSPTADAVSRIDEFV